MLVLNCVEYSALCSVLASAVSTESADAAAEAAAVPAAGLGCWPGGTVASFDSSAYCCSHRQQPQPSRAEGFLV